MSLSWPASSDDRGVVGYEIWRSRSASTGFTQVATSATTSYADGSLARRTRYSYQVLAYDAAGNRSGISPTASAVTS